jgi:protein TonB
MRIHMLALSAALHVGLGASLIAVAQKRETRRKAISVAVQDEKKKEAKPKPPQPPKPIVHKAAPKPAAVLAKADTGPAPVHVKSAAPAAPVVTNLAMSNADIGPGIGLYGRAPAPKAAPAPVKVASALSERRTRRTEEAAGEEPCNEEATKPKAIVQTPLDYSLHPQAQADGIEGKFRARVTVDANGEVSNVDVLRGVEAALDAAVVAALKTWRFKPATACGKPVAGGTVVIEGRFELGD